MKWLALAPQPQYRSGMASPPPRPANLPSLDLGRFIAALLVAFFHISITVHHLVGEVPFSGIFRGGHSGVAYFFVLSGFIILYVHRRDLGHGDRIADFARKRVIRIVPVLWATMIGWGLIRLQLPGGTAGALDPMMILCDSFLIPHPAGDGVIGAIWTLRRELVFYLLFAIAIVDRRTGIALLVFWQAAILLNLVSPFFHLPPEPDMLLGVHNLGFGIGLALAYFVPLRPLRFPVAAMGLGALLYAGVLATEWCLGNPSHLELKPMSETMNAIAYLTASALIVAGMVSYDIQRQAERSAASSLLGDCSYALYLTHGPISSIAIRLLQPLWPWLRADLLAVSLVAISVLAAILVNRWFERPVARALRSWSGLKTPKIVPEASRG